MTGSEKQVVWASEIKSTVLSEYRMLSTELRAAGLTDAATACEAIIERLERCENAKWWIEQRDAFALRDQIAMESTHWHGFSPRRVASVYPVNSLSAAGLKMGNESRAIARAMSMGM